MEQRGRSRILVVRHGDALAAAQTLLETSQLIEMELTTSKEKAVKTSALPKSHAKTRGSSRKGRRGVSVLTDVKVLEIKRQLQAGGKSVAKIAREFGVHVTTINCIKWGKTWKHVVLQQDKPATVVICTLTPETC